jgi:putative oxidoreductase
MGSFAVLNPKWSARLLGVLRIVAGLLFLLHGTQKIFGFPAPMEPEQPSLFSLLGLAGLIEFLGGLLMTIGLFTRPVAFVLAGEMAFAYFMGHATQGFWPILNQGEPAVLYCFIFLYFAAAGAGEWSVDREWEVQREARSRGSRRIGATKASAS